MKEDTRHQSDLRTKENNYQRINWKHLLSSLRRHAKQHEMSLPDEFLETLKRIAAHCGSHSVGHKRLRELGKSMLLPVPRIIVPLCLNENDLRERDSVPQIVLKQSIFLARILDRSCWGSWQHPSVLLLVPTYALDSSALDILKRIQIHVTDRGWNAVPMTELVPDIEARELACMERLSRDPESSRKVSQFTEARVSAGMYRQIPRTQTDLLSLRTCAQYSALGTFAAERQMIICSHSTLNLYWYKKAGAAILHNPVFL